MTLEDKKIFAQNDFNKEGKTYFYFEETIKQALAELDKKSDEICSDEIPTDNYERGFKAGWNCALTEFWDIVEKVMGKSLMPKEVSDE